MRSAAALLVSSLVSLCAAPVPAAAPASPDHWSAIVDCATRTPDERARHACVDEVLRGAGVLSDEQRAREQRLRFGRTHAPGSTPPAAAPTVPSPPPPADPDTLEMTIATVSEARDGRLILTTEDGAVWRQTDDKPFARTPAAGQSLTVRKAALGSFFCQVNGRAGFRCVRSR